MTLHYKVFLHATGRFSWNGIFYDKPPEIRKVLQDEITQVRYDWGESIWLHTFQAWMRALHEIVGVHPPGVAVTDMRFLTEIRGIKKMGSKILHLKAADQQQNIAPERRGHRAEVELDSSKVPLMRAGYILNPKDGIDALVKTRESILHGWGWL